MSGISRHTVPSMTESVQRDSAEQWKALTRRHATRVVAVCGLLGATVLVAVIVVLNGGHLA